MQHIGEPCLHCQVNVEDPDGAGEEGDQEDQHQHHHRQHSDLLHLLLSLTLKITVRWWRGHLKAAYRARDRRIMKKCKPQEYRNDITAAPDSHSTSSRCNYYRLPRGSEVSVDKRDV